MDEDNLSRREFVQGLAGAVSSDALTGAREASAPSESDRKVIGIQVGAVSFVDEGVEQTLDILQEQGAVNTLFLAVFTYGRGIAGRQIPGQPLPDHGRQAYDTAQFHGGNYATPHPAFYKNTPIQPAATRAPDFGELDILQTVLPAAKRRGMQVYGWLEDVWRTDVPGVAPLREQTLAGKPAGTLCFNHPGHRAFLEGLVEDYVASYPIDGLMWGCERQGAFSNALGAMHGGAGQNPMAVTCFCRYCQAKAKKRGLNFTRVQAGFDALARFVRAARAGQRPTDGCYVTLWRLMLRYPELLAWEQLWHDSLRETYQALYQKVKAVRPEVAVGWHIWHNNSFSPLYRAEQDLAELSKYSDFLKMVMYHNCGGPRIASYVDSVGQTLYGDVPPAELLSFHYRALNYDEAPYASVRRAGLKNDYVYRETRRAVERAAGTKTRIFPGIDIDIPTGADEARSTPEDVRAAVRQALQAGAQGVILSRKYSEMRLANLRAAGEAIRQPEKQG
jgi:hypothetical protein